MKLGKKVITDENMQTGTLAPTGTLKLGAKIELGPSDTDIESITEQNRIDPKIEKRIIETGDLDMAMRVSKGDLGYALSRTRGIQPDHAAKVSALAKQLNMPKDTIYRNTLTAEEIAEGQKIINIIGERDEKGQAKYPYTLGWLSQSDKMAQAKDDVTALAEIETAMRKASQKDEGLMKQTARSLAAGSLLAAKSVTQLPGLAEALGLEYIEQEVLKGAKTGLKTTPALMNNPITKFLDDSANAIRSVKADESAIGLIKEGKYADAINNIYLSAVENAPNLLVMLGLSVASSGAAGLAYAGATTAASEYAQDIKDPNRSRTDVARGAILKGGAEAAFEIVTLHNSKLLFSSLGKQLTKEAGEEAANITLKGVFERLVKDSAAEGTSEYLTSLSQDLADHFTGKKDALNGSQEKALNSLLVGGFTGGVLSGAGNVAAFNAKVLKTRQSMESLDKVNEVLQDSKTAKRNLDLITDFLNGQSQGENVYIPLNAVTAYFQEDGNKVKSFAEALGITPEELTSAETNGTDIVVKKGDFMALDLKPEFKGVYKGLRESVKTSADGFTLGELDTLQEEFKADIADATELAKEQKKEEQLPPKLLTMKDNLVSNFGMTPKDADAQLAILYAGAKTFAAKQGKTIDEYLGDIELQIGKEPVSTEGSFNQAPIKTDTPEFKNWFGDSQVKDETGAPLVVYHGSNTSIKTFDNDMSAQGVFWFSSNRDKIAKGESGAASTKYIIPVYLKADKLAGWKEYDKYSLAEIENMGFDGIKLDDDYIIFNPEQIKSVDNRGTFNPEDPNIYNQDALGFYSKLSDEVSKMDFKAMPAKDLLNRVKKLGLKQDELDYSGIIEYLQGIEGKVNKEDVVAFLNNGGVKIEEIVKGGQASRELSIVRHQDDAFLFDVVDPNTGDKIKENLSRSAAEDYVDNYYDGKGDTKYSSYIEPGSKNYREVLLTLPQKESGPVSVNVEEYGIKSKIAGDGVSKSIEVFRKKDNSFVGRSIVPADISDQEAIKTVVAREVKREVDKTNVFTSGHFEEKNILAHFRLSDHDNGKTLFIEEIQSDWHQAGRDKGYKGDKVISPKLADEKMIAEKNLKEAKEELPIAENKAREAIKNTYSKWESAAQDPEKRDQLIADTRLWNFFADAMLEKGSPERQAIDDYKEANSSIEAWEKRLKDINVNIMYAESFKVPDAPFKNTEAWAMLAFKRILRKAAEEGYDSVQWTTGEQQAERYDLSKQVDKIVYNKDESGMYSIQAIKGGSEVFNKTDVSETELPGILGKDLANKMKDGEGEASITEDEVEIKTLGGLDLKVGGEGMKGFYDNILPKAVDKYIKKLDKGAKIETPTKGIRTSITDAELSELNKLANTNNRTPEQTARYLYLGKINDGTNRQENNAYWTLELTDQIKTEVLKGQSLFQEQGKKKPRGSIQFAENGKSIINLYETANYSTLLHEMGHFFTNELKKLIDTGKASEQDSKDFEALVNFAGGELNREGHEKIARGFEAYLREGKAPSVSLQKAFRKIKTWLLNIYRSLAGLNVQINDEVREIFDRILASEAEITEAQTLYKTRQTAKSIFDNMKLTKEQQERLDKLREEAKAEALEAQVAKTLNVYFKAIGRTPLDEANVNTNTLIASGKNLLKDQANKQVAEMPVYKVINEATTLGGYDANEFSYYAGDTAVSEVAKKFPGFFRTGEISKSKTYRDLVLENSRGIDPTSFTEEQRKMIKDKGAFRIYNTKGVKLDVLATNLVNEGKLVVPTDRNDADFLFEKILDNSVFEKEYISGGKGNELDAAAIHYEYESTEALVDAITKALPIKDAQKQMYKDILSTREAQIREAIRNSEITYDGEEALYNEAALDYLVEEAKILADRTKSNKKYDTKVYRDASRQAIGIMKVKDAMRYDKYVTKERQFSKDILEAINKSDKKKIEEAKEKQIRNNALVLSSVEAREKVSKYLAKAKRIANAPKGAIIGEYHDAILLLLSNHGLYKKKPSRPDKVNLANIIDDLENGVDKVIVPDIIRDDKNITSYKDMTLEDLENLMAGISILAARGRNVVKLNKEGKEQTIEEKAEDCVDVLNFDKKGGIRKVVEEPKKNNPFYLAIKGWRGLLAEITHVQFDLKRADGYTGLNLKDKNWKSGPNEEMFDIIFEKRKDAARMFNEFNNKYMKEIGEQLKNIHNRLNTGTKGISIPNVILPGILRENGYTGWTSEMIIAVALNAGNEGNKQGLIKGLGMTEQEVQNVMGQLTIKELETIQSIWDALDVLFTPMDDVHYKQNGFRLKKVAASPITVQARDESGTLRFHTLKGGYYPVKHDAELSRKVAGYTEKDIMKDETLAVHHRSKPRDSFTKERVGSVLPIKLSIQPLYKHIQDTINYINLAEVLTDVYKVIKSDSYANAYSKTMGKERYNILTPFLSSIARPEPIGDGTVDFVLNKLQRLTAIGALGASVLTFAKQLPALISAGKELEFRHIAYGCAQIIKSPFNAIKEVETKSIFIKDRHSKVQMEIAKQLDQINPFTKRVTIFGKELSIKDLQDFALQNIRLGDLLGAYPTWIGAYNKKINEGLSEKDAITFADKLLSETQPTSDAMFNNLWQQGGARNSSAGKMIRWVIAPFTGWTMKYGSRQRTYWNAWREGAISTKDYAEHVMLEAILPCLMVPLLTTLIHGDDDAEKWESYIYEVLGYNISSIPVLNQVPRLVQYGTRNGVMEMPTAKPAKLGAEVVISGGKVLQDGENYVQFLKALGNIAEFYYGVPAMKAAKEIDKGAEAITKMTD